jgi:NADH-quinone oxidoreductase subunit N
MAWTDLAAILPLLVVAAAAVLVLLAAAWTSRGPALGAWTALGLVAALAALPIAAGTIPRQVTPLLSLDRYALFYLGLLFAAALAVTALSLGYLERRGLRQGEFHVLLLLGTLGAAVLVCSSHFASFFLGLELLSVSLYTLIAYVRTEARPLEAGLKYLILAGASSAFLLFGIAVLYAQTGTLRFVPLPGAAGAPGPLPTGYVLAGLAILLTGVGFKLAVVPFHMWTPDVYEGAPAPVTAFVATVSKGAVLALFLRYVTLAHVAAIDSVWRALAVIAVASMLAGNLLALLQGNVKRLLAYSSIAHLGYLLVAFLASGPRAAEAVTFYLVAYIATTLGAFGVVSVLSGGAREAEALESYRALFWRRPGIAFVLTAMLLSLAGIPLTAGFVGKFFLLSAGIGSALWLLVFVLVLGSAIGLFYYLRVVVAMFAAPLPEDADGPAPATPLLSAGALTLLVLTIVVVLLGVYPAPLIGLIQSAAASLG